MHLRHNMHILDIEDEEKGGTSNYEEFIINIKEYTHFTESWNTCSEIYVLKLRLQFIF